MSDAKEREHLNTGRLGGDIAPEIRQRHHHPIAIFDSIAFRAPSRSQPVCCM